MFGFVSQADDGQVVEIARDFLIHHTFLPLDLYLLASHVTLVFDVVFDLQADLFGESSEGLRETLQEVRPGDLVALEVLVPRNIPDP